MKKPLPDPEYPPDEIERRRDDTVKRMIAMQPKTLKGTPKRAKKDSDPK